MKYSEIIEQEKLREESYNQLPESEKRKIQEVHDRILSRPAVPFDIIQTGYYYIISVKPFGTNTTLLNAIYSETGDFANGIEHRIDRTKFYNKNSFYNEIQSPTFQDYPIEVKDLIHVKKCELVASDYKNRVYQSYSITWNKITAESK